MLADEIDDLFDLHAGRTNFASQGNCSYSTLLYVMGVICLYWQEYDVLEDPLIILDHRRIRIRIVSVFFAI